MCFFSFLSFIHIVSFPYRVVDICSTHLALSWVARLFFCTTCVLGWSSARLCYLTLPHHLVPITIFHSAARKTGWIVFTLVLSWGSHQQRFPKESSLKSIKSCIFFSIVPQDYRRKSGKVRLRTLWFVYYFITSSGG